MTPTMGGWQIPYHHHTLTVQHESLLEHLLLLVWWTEGEFHSVERKIPIDCVYGMGRDISTCILTTCYSL